MTECQYFIRGESSSSCRDVLFAAILMPVRIPRNAVRFAVLSKRLSRRQRKLLRLLRFLLRKKQGQCRTIHCPLFHILLNHRAVYPPGTDEIPPCLNAHPPVLLAQSREFTAALCSYGRERDVSVGICRSRLILAFPGLLPNTFLPTVVTG
jgi:hypothetical protein